ncbi:MAG: hypothetical protein ACTSSK_03300 [Candidatus Heimdallarchaeota archaeon]
MSKKYNKQITGNTGLYYVCYELSKREWNVLPTSRNARGADILAYSLDRKRTIAIEVKSLSGNDPISFNPTTTISDFLIICRYVYDVPEIFIARIDDEFKLKVTIREKNGKKSYWIKTKDFEPYKDNWDIIGKGT